MTAPRSMPCPACRFGVSMQATERGGGDANSWTVAWCTGAGSALSNPKIVNSLCEVCAATVREASDSEVSS